MKKSVLVMVFGLALSVGAIANNQGVEPVGVHTAKFDTLRVDPDLGMLVNAGTVEVDYDAKEVTLTLYRYIECVKAPCPIGMPAPYVATLPIVSISYGNACGERIISAQEDFRPFDGAYRSIQITDNSTNFCKSMHIVPGVEATYDTAIWDRINGQEVKTSSSFSSWKRLERVVMGF